MSSSDKKWAQAQILGPLTAPEPSDETGPGSSLVQPKDSVPAPALPSSLTRPKDPETASVQSNASTRSLSTVNPFHNNGSPRPTPKSTPAPSVRELKPGFVERSYPSPPGSKSPRPSGGSPNHRQEYMNPTTRPRRSSSLKQRFPGDPSVSPLSQLAKEKAIADRARHITKNHAIRPDTIDSLDASGLDSYHHEGPYDATLFARNNSWKSSPVAAVKETNEEALRATPHEKIIDSVKSHRPLDGVAAFPPGTQDRNGHVYKYKEGDNMMIDENAGGGPYKRWSGVQYHPDDIKGKGEPSYTIEKALKEKKLDEKSNGDATSQGIELQSDANRSRSGSASFRTEAFSADNDGGLARSNSLGNKLKMRVGSLRKKKE